MELCLMCDNKSSSLSTSGTEDDSANSSIIFMHSNLLTLFVSYFNLTSEELESLQRQLGQDFPFCKRCEPILTDLGRLQSQLISAQNDISNALNHITSTIRNLVSVNSSRGQDSEEPKQVAIHNARKTICANYTPRVVIQDPFIHMNVKSEDPRYNLPLWGPPYSELTSTIQNEQSQGKTSKQNNKFNSSTELETDDDEEEEEADDRKYGHHFKKEGSESDNDVVLIKEEPSSPYQQTSDLPLEVELSLKNTKASSSDIPQRKRKRVRPKKGEVVLNSKETPRKRPKATSDKTKSPKKRQKLESKGEKGAKNKKEDGQGPISSADDNEGGSNKDAVGGSSLPLSNQKQKKNRRDNRICPVIEESPGVCLVQGTEFRFYQSDNREGHYICKVCNNNTELKKTSLIYHYRRHHDKSIFRCDKCHQPFVNEESLDKHKCHPKTKRTVHHRKRNFTDLGNGKYLYEDEWPFEIIEPDSETGTDRTYKCGTCQAILLHEDLLVRHQREKHMELKYVCETCGRAFDIESRLRSHQLKHIGVKSFMCEDCGATFLTRGKMNTHRKWAHRIGLKPEDLRCSYPGCGREFTSRISISRHRQATQHWAPKKERKEGYCKLCKRKYLVGPGHKSHEESCTGQETFPCILCKKILRSKLGIRQHMELVHGTTFKSITENLIPSNDADVQGSRGNTPGVSVDSSKSSSSTVSESGASNTTTTTTTTSDNTQLCNTIVKPGTFPCGLCEKVFKSKNGRDEHEERVHGTCIEEKDTDTTTMSNRDSTTTLSTH